MITLKKLHGNSKHYLPLLDKICQFLSKLTIPYVGASTAYLSWDLVSALRKHVPGPLSGLISDQTSISSLGSSVHTMNTLGNSNQWMKGIDDENEDYSLGLGNMSAALFQLLTNLCQLEEAKINCYADGYLRRGLDKLLFVYYHFNQQSSLNEEICWYKSMKEALKRQNLPINPSKCHLDCLSLVKFIDVLTNFNHYKHGNSNDLIFYKKYNIVGLLQELIRFLLYKCECLRYDELYLSLIELMKSLSQDKAKFSVFCEEYDILGLIHSELNDHLHEYQIYLTFPHVTYSNNNKMTVTSIETANMKRNIDKDVDNDIMMTTSLSQQILNDKPNDFEAFPWLKSIHSPESKLRHNAYEISTLIINGKRVLYCMMEIIHNMSTTSLESIYLAEKFMLLRAPLVKLSRIFPEFQDKVLECNWAITLAMNSSLKAFKGRFKSSLNTDIVDYEYIRDYDRSLTLTSQRTISEARESSDTNLLSNTMNMTKMNDKIKDLGDIPDKHADFISDSKLKLISANTVKLRPLSGGYSDCGVSTCGSLRLPSSELTSSHNHRTFNKSVDSLNSLKTSDDELRLRSSETSLDKIYADGVCEISRIPAKSKKLQETIEYRKRVYGFKKRIPSDSDVTIHNKSMKSSSNKVHDVLNLKAWNTAIVNASPIKTKSILSSSNTAINSSLMVVSVDQIPELARTRPVSLKPFSTIHWSNDTI